MSFQFICRRPLALALVSAASAFSVHAAPMSSLGYEARELFRTDPFVFAGGLDVADGAAFFTAGTNVVKLTLSNASWQTVGSLPSPNVGASYVRVIGDEIFIAYADAYGFPPSYRYGLVGVDGVFRDQGGQLGIYDAAVDSAGTLYLAAYPPAFGTTVYRFETATTTLVEVIRVGGFSGGLAFDADDRLYVAEQTAGRILRFTPEQLQSGNLTAAHGEVMADIQASYLCFDGDGRLYAVTDYGNRLVQIDLAIGDVVREVAFDSASGYGLGWLDWDNERNQLLVVHTDYYVDSASTVQAITFARSTNGLPGATTPFQGWIAAIDQLVQPDPGSGGFSEGAIVGKPEAFDPEDGTTHVRSLGNGGSITLAFDDLIVNGPGADFAVFENGFNYGDLTFAELAFVEVATTTNAWARFPVTYYPGTPVGPYEGLDAAQVDGVAGKHALEYGTPFDLDWLRHHTNVLSGAVDLNRIAYIRLIDIVGDGSVHDQFGRPIYDPYQASAAMTDGFDLRAIGVVHHAGVEFVSMAGAPALRWYGYAGRTYQPHVSGGGAWTDHGVAVPGTGGWHQVSVPTGAPFQMMRVQQTIPEAATP